MTDYKYILQPYRPGSKGTCPECERKNCFTYYINKETGERLSDDCGICDHKNSCGHHYPPKAYFHDHPTHSEDWQRKELRKPMKLPAPPAPATLRATAPAMGVPEHLVAQSHGADSTFMQWLGTKMPDQEAVQRAYDTFRLGATKDGGVIFWQIDTKGLVRTGHIMHYDADGHRCGAQNWVHAIMKRNGQLPRDWTLTQCFFGEHQLAERPDDTVCLVESEKSAVILTVLYPQFVWLSSCGCGGLNAGKAEVLKGRRLVVYPDSGTLEKWRKAMAATQGIRYSFVTDLEAYPPNTDIVDLLFAAASPQPATIESECHADSSSFMPSSPEECPF